MGAYLMGVVQVCSVADKKFIEELTTGYGDFKLPGYDYFNPYPLQEDLFQRPYFGFTVKYGSMSKIKDWLIELSTRHNQPIIVTMDYDSQSYDAFTNIPGALPKSKRFWGYDGPFDRETDERDEREIKELNNGF